MQKLIIESLRLSDIANLQICGMKKSIAFCGYDIRYLSVTVMPIKRR